MNKEFPEIEIDEYHGVQLQVYNKIWGLVSLYLAGGEQTCWYKRWAFPQIWKNSIAIPQRKAKPVAVRIGDSREEAIKTLENILEQIKGI